VSKKRKAQSNQKHQKGDNGLCQILPPNYDHHLNTGPFQTVPSSSHHPSFTLRGSGGCPHKLYRTDQLVSRPFPSPFPLCFSFRMPIHMPMAHTIYADPITLSPLSFHPLTKPHSTNMALAKVEPSHNLIHVEHTLRHGHSTHSDTHQHAR
jgi:hypothetical protein